VLNLTIYRTSFLSLNNAGKKTVVYSSNGKRNKVAYDAAKMVLPGYVQNAVNQQSGRISRKYFGG
jgi:hypothetical protein